MIRLRQSIMQVLLDYHDRVYFQKASNDKPFQNVVYNLTNSFTDTDQEIFNLDVDIWDNQDDTTDLETIASNIWRGLNRLNYIDEDIQFSIYRANRLPPLDEDEKNIKRRKLIFQLRYFDRRLNSE